MTISYYALFATIVLLPLFVLPPFPVEAGKGLLLFIGILAALAAWCVSSLSSGRVALPKHPILLAALAVPASVLLSAVFSPVPFKSFFGTWFESGTAAFSLVAWLAMFLSAALFDSRKKIFSLYAAMFGAFFLLSASGMLLLFAAGRVPALDGFFASVGTLIGSWSDVALFFGFFLSLILLTFQFLPLSRTIKGFMLAGVAISLFFLAAVHFLPAWVMAGASALLIFIYSLSFSERRRFPVPAFAVVLVSLFFILSHANGIGSFLSSRLGVANLNVRPSAGATLQVGRDALAENPLFGPGPNRFSQAWLKHKPLSVNSTDFADTAFAQGFGRLPTQGIATGAIGTLAILSFLALFLYHGGRMAWKAAQSASDDLSRYVILSSFVGALYLWTASVFLVPGTVLTVLAFVLTGVLAGTGRGATVSVPFLSDPRRSFFAILSLSAAVLLSVAGIYLAAERAAAAIYYQKSAAAGTVEEADRYMERALSLERQDLYYRARAEQLLSRLQSSPLALREAEAAAQEAVRLDDTSLENWKTLARVYVAGMSLGAEGARENALEALGRMSELHPASPAIELLKGQTEALAGNYAAAVSHAERALGKKGNYADAYVFLSRVASEEKRDADMERYARLAVEADPDSGEALFHYGLVQYRKQSWAAAISALERLVSLNGRHMEGRYYLALSYARAGRRQEAISALELLSSAYPSDAAIRSALDSVRAGRDPQ